MFYINLWRTQECNLKDSIHGNALVLFVCHVLLTVSGSYIPCRCTSWISLSLADMFSTPSNRTLLIISAYLYCYFGVWDILFCTFVSSLFKLMHLPHGDLNYVVKITVICHLSFIHASYLLYSYILHRSLLKDFSFEVVRCEYKFMKTEMFISK